MEKQQKYGFLTAVSMVVGIVIGSGIFFKADDILLATGGSVKLGLLGFLLVGVGVLFGALVISQYAIKNPSEGGIVAYSKDAFGDKVAYGVSWFLISLYFPALIVILGIVAAGYIGELFGLTTTFFTFLFTFLLIAFSFLTNVLSKRFGGIVQSGSTIIKVIPLIIIGLVGLFFSNYFSSPSTAQVTQEVVNNRNFLGALISIAFAFDGWIVVTAISKDLKNPTKTLPRALMVGSFAITIIYCLYFIGLTNLISPAEILQLNNPDTHVYLAAEAIFGPIGSTVLKLFIIISVYGGLNGMTLAYLRLPHALVHKGMMKNILNIEKINPKYDLSMGGLIYTLIFTFLFFIIQLLITTGVIFSNLANPFDISTMPIIFNYIIYTALYLFVFKVTGKRNLSLIIFVALASITSLIVIYGSLQVNGLLYIATCLLFIAFGIPFYNKDKQE